MIMKVLFIKENQIVAYDASEVTIADAQNFYEKGYVMHVLNDNDLITYEVIKK